MNLKQPRRNTEPRRGKLVVLLSMGTARETRRSQRSLNVFRDASFFLLLFPCFLPSCWKDESGVVNNMLMEDVVGFIEREFPNIFE